MHANFFGDLLDHHGLEVVDAFFQKIVLAGHDAITDLGNGLLALLDILDQLDGALVALFHVIARVLIVGFAGQQFFVCRVEAKLRQVIGCVFQDFRLLQQKTVFENVAFALEVIGKRADVINRVVPDVLEMVGLSGKASRLPSELSGGEQQRVAIARAFVNRPLVLLADEPTGNLDPETSNDIMDLLERINRTGTTVLMATHDHHIVDTMRQRVVELSLGRLVRDEQRGVYGMDR